MTHVLSADRLCCLVDSELVDGRPLMSSVVNFLVSKKNNCGVGIFCLHILSSINY